jgi:hypothetical protein
MYKNQLLKLQKELLEQKNKTLNGETELRRELERLTNEYINMCHQALDLMEQNMELSETLENIQKISFN